MPKSVAMALYFYPRGGSAQVVRYLAGHLKKSVNIKIFSGSLGEAGAPTHAGTFFADLDPTVLDYSAADREWRNGGDPLRTDPPMHGSFEDRPGVPDTFLANLSPDLAELQTTASPKAKAPRRKLVVIRD